jgi:predicted RND superfamily exporter protein
VTPRVRAAVVRVVDGSGRHPLAVIACALLVLAGLWTYAYTHFQLNADLLELLPRDSPGVRAFEHQLGRVGGGFSLVVVVESPNRAANERFIDELDLRLERLAKSRPDLVSYVEAGTKDVHAFFDTHKWLYADLSDLEKADARLDHEIAVRSGLIESFDDEEPSPPPGGAAAKKTKTKDLGLDEYEARWKSRSSKFEDFPTGYFATPDGGMWARRIVAGSRGLGDAAGDSLLARVRGAVDEIDPKALDARMQVGYAGDIANAIEEKDSLVSDAAWATGGAFLLIFLGVVFFFRSPWAPLVLALPALIGVGAAYSFAMAQFGYVNTTGAFLGAIILGNGINYPIVLLHRYREFRARGMTPEVARREAVLNAFRAELVGACVAAIAYGSLVVTSFRGFVQFGVIGFVGMLLVWLSMIPCVPALLVVDEWIQARVPPWLRDRPLHDPSREARGPLMGRVAWLTEKAPLIVLALGALGVVWAARPLDGYLTNPWEYDFSNIGSRHAQVSGAGAWSTKADRVFGGKTNIAGAMMLADTPEQVPEVKQAILDNDARDPKGRLITDIVTVDDFLPGPVADQQKKIAVLERIRSRLTPAVLAKLDPDERRRVDEIEPPPKLAPVTAKDLPPLLRRRFEEVSGRVGTVFYVKFRNDISFSDGHVLLRIAQTTDNVHLRGGTVVQTASRSTIFAEIVRSMEHDGPLATYVSLFAVIAVVVVATGSLRGAVAVLLALGLGVVATLGSAAHEGMKLNFFNFIALPITFGIGSEYPFNVFDRARLLRGDVSSALRLSGGAVALCSYTTTIGYASMLVSDQRALQSFGRLAMTGEIACATAALVIMPAFLQATRRRRADPTRAG